MSKTKTPTIKSTSVPSAYDTPLTSLEYLRKVEEQNAQVLARQDEIEEALNDRVAKSGDTMTGTLNVPQVNANTGVFHALNAVSQDGNTHVEVSNGGFIAEVTEETTGNKKYGVIAYPNGKVGFYAHDSAHNKDVNFIIPNMDDYGAGTFELATKSDIPSGGSSLLEDIEDADGHKAYEEFLQTEAPANTNPLYVKAIRNGLVLEVICYTEVTSISPSGMTLGIIPIPQYISDKIIFGQSEQYVIGSVVVSLSRGSTSTSVTGTIKKINDKIYIMMDSTSALTRGYARCHYTLGL